MQNIAMPKIKMIGLGSPEHYNIWNNLSLETLVGDLRGYFNDILISVKSTNSLQKVDEIVDFIMADSAPEILGISVQPGSLALVEKFIGLLKENKNFDFSQTLVVFGNQLPTYFPEIFLDICPESIVVKGEGELVLRSIVEYKMGKGGLFDVPNISYMNDGKVIHTRVEDVDLELLKYPPIISDDFLKNNCGNIQIQASRGCPWGGCFYCTRTSFRKGGLVIKPGKYGRAASWQGFSIERVLQVLDDVMSKKIKEVEFSDDDFTGGRGDKEINRILDIVKGIQQLKQKHNIPDFSFRIFTRPDIVYNPKDSEKNNEKMYMVFDELKKAGLVKVFIGIEAGNVVQLKRYNRGYHFDCVSGSLEVLKKLDLGVDVGFIMYDPDLRLSEMMENIMYFRNNELIKYNQWPFRPLLVNEGAKIVEWLRNKGTLGQAYENFMCYDYKYADNNVEKIQGIVDDVSIESKVVFYNLKIKSKKYFDPNKQDKETVKAQDYIEKNGLIFLDLMENLGNIVVDASSDAIDEVKKNAYERISLLLKELEMDVANNIISDDDDFLKDEMRKIKNNSVNLVW